MRTRRSERSIRRDVSEAERISGEMLTKIARTWVEKQSEIAALATMDKQERQKIADRLDVVCPWQAARKANAASRQPPGLGLNGRIAIGARSACPHQKIHGAPPVADQVLSNEPRAIPNGSILIEKALPQTTPEIMGNRKAGADRSRARNRVRRLRR